MCWSGCPLLFIIDELTFVAADLLLPDIFCAFNSNCLRESRDGLATWSFLPLALITALAFAFRDPVGFFPTTVLPSSFLGLSTACGWSARAVWKNCAFLYPLVLFAS